MVASVCAVSINSNHGFSKQSVEQITLVTGYGVCGDAHYGVTVKHRSRVAQDPTQPNLRQVHLIHQELLDDLKHEGFAVRPGDLGENITTLGLDLLALPQGTVLKIGSDASIRLTGLRNPCYQIDDFSKGLLKHVLTRASDGALIRKSGAMAVVERDGRIGPGDPIEVVIPGGVFVALEPV